MLKILIYQFVNLFYVQQVFSHDYLFYLHMMKTPIFQKHLIVY